jgi:hypothetical protein
VRITWDVHVEREFVFWDWQHAMSRQRNENAILTLPAANWYSISKVVWIFENISHQKALLLSGKAPGREVRGLMYSPIP